MYQYIATYALCVSITMKSVDPIDYSRIGDISYFIIFIISLIGIGPRNEFCRSAGLNLWSADPWGSATV
jgi:hypothetical protein